MIDFPRKMDDFRAEIAKVQREHEALYCSRNILLLLKTDGGMSVDKVGTV